MITDMARSEPRSATRMRMPVGKSIIRTDTPVTEAGYISSGSSDFPLIDGRGLATTARRNAQRARRTTSHHVDSSARQASDEAEPEGDVGPPLVAAHVILERIHGPEQRVGAARRARTLVRMPHAGRVAIVEEAVVQLAPVVVFSQEAETRHELEPRDGEHHIVVRRVLVRQEIAKHEMRLRDDFLADQLQRLLARQRL